jgi:hypothetical protein
MGTATGKGVSALMRGNVGIRLVRDARHGGRAATASAAAAPPGPQTGEGGEDALQLLLGAHLALGGHDGRRTGGGAPPVRSRAPWTAVASAPVAGMMGAVARRLAHRAP